MGEGAKEGKNPYIKQAGGSVASMDAVVGDYVEIVQDTRVAEVNEGIVQHLISTGPAEVGGPEHGKLE